MEALRWAREPRPQLSHPAAAVLRDLADRTNDRGHCWPAVATVAAATSLSERAVRYALRELEDARLVATKRTGRANIYTVAAPAVCRSEGHHVQDRPAPRAPKALESHRPAAHAYNPGATAHPLPAVELDAEMLELAQNWLAAH